MDLISVDWPAPENVKSYFTTRNDGFSSGVYQGLNLGAHVGDDLTSVNRNRALLNEELKLRQNPIWLNQVHGTNVYQATSMQTDALPTADAAVTTMMDVPLTVMTADCLPLLFCDTAGQVVATAHAGWRGLCEGVIEATVKAMNVDPQNILVWLGPAIGPTAFEVGDEVRTAFTQKHVDAKKAFKPYRDSKWLADIFLLARQRLQLLGIHKIYGGDHCTYSNPAQFYSYRRDGQTGRMAGLIWLTINF